HHYDLATTGVLAVEDPGQQRAGIPNQETAWFRQKGETGSARQRGDSGGKVLGPGTRLPGVGDPEASSHVHGLERLDTSLAEILHHRFQLLRPLAPWRGIGDLRSYMHSHAAKLDRLQVSSAAGHGHGLI